MKKTGQKGRVTKKDIERLLKEQTAVILSTFESHIKKSEICFSRKWETVADFRKIRKGGVDINELLSRLQSIDQHNEKTYK